MRRKEKIKYKCGNCGKKLKIFPCLAKKFKQHFCNRKCQAKGMIITPRKTTFEKLQCEICLGYYLLPKYKVTKAQAKICSKKCSAKFPTRWKNGRRCVKCGLVRKIKYFRELPINKQRNFIMYASFCGFCRRRHKNLKGIEVGKEIIPSNKLKDLYKSAYCGKPHS